MCNWHPEVGSVVCPICDSEDQFELDWRTLGGERLVEVRRNGESWNSPWDAHFVFGRRKVKMAIECMDIIRRFIVSAEPGSMLEQPITRCPDPELTIQLRTVPRFVAHGESVEIPYLILQEVAVDRTPSPLQFGQSKAVALVVLENKLKTWLKAVGGWHTT